MDNIEWRLNRGSTKQCSFRRHQYHDQRHFKHAPEHCAKPLCFTKAKQVGKRPWWTLSGNPSYMISTQFASDPHSLDNWLAFCLRPAPVSCSPTKLSCLTLLGTQVPSLTQDSSASTSLHAVWAWKTIRDHECHATVHELFAGIHLLRFGLFVIFFLWKNTFKK